MKKIFSFFAALLFAGSMMADSYVKVTEAPENWAGDYLLVYETGNVAFNGALETFDAVANTIAVTINNGAIAATDVTNAAKITIAAVEGGYSVQGASGKYLGATSYANSLVTSDAAIVNKLAVTNGNVAMTVTTEGGDVTMKFNSASNQTRFRYYKSGQQDVQLYKLTAGETPEPEPEPEPEPVVSNVVYNWAKAAADKVGATIFGPVGTSESTVKINTNTKSVDCLKFDKSYSDTTYVAVKPAEGAFKAGDTIKASVVFNNSSDAKYCMLDVYAADGSTRLWRTDSATTINGRTSAADPAIQNYVLEADQDSLLLGRYGNTGMCVTFLQVVRPEGSVTPVVEAISLTQFIADKPATEVELKDLTVIYATGKNTYVIDEDGVALVMYDASKTYYDGTLTAGKVLSGQKATYTSYNNQDEIIPTNAVVATDGTAPVPVTMEAAPSVDANVNQYLRFENVAATETSGKYYIFDNVQLYGASADLKPTEAGNYNVEGIFINFKGNTPELIVTAIEKAGGVTPVEGDTILLDVDYADAMHITSYQAWQLNFYKDYSQAEGVTYPDFYVMLKEKSATTLAGTYSASAGEIYFVQVFTSEKDSASAVQVTEFKIEYKGEGMYAVQFAFLGDDGNTYVLMGNFEFDAYEYDTWEEIELTDALVEAVENVDAAVKAVKMLINGNVVIEKNGVQYNVNGAKL